MTSSPTPSDVVAAYRKRIAGYLGDQDPLHVLERTPVQARALVREHGVARLRVRPIEGKWTPLEVLGHLCDCEWVYGYRTRLILCEDNPTLMAMDQDGWVAAQRHNERDPIELAEQFSALRKHNLQFWHGLTVQELERTGLHNERGPESLGLLRTLIAGHDLLHLDQMKRLLMAIV
jgi:hypothetical protein